MDKVLTKYVPTTAYHHQVKNKEKGTTQVTCNSDDDGLGTLNVIDLF